MNTLYVINETYSNGYRIEILDILSIAAILCAILVIVSKNPIVSVLFLIGLFLSISSYLITLGLNFIGLSYLLVYVGAVSILFLFILMLINVRVSELLSNTSNGIPMAMLILISFSYPVSEITPYGLIAYNTYMAFINKITNIISGFLFTPSSLSEIKLESDQVFFVTGKLWDGNLSESSHITSMGSVMYTSYSMWLILTSIILLLAMVGAIVITIKPRRAT